MSGQAQGASLQVNVAASRAGTGLPGGAGGQVEGSSYSYKVKVWPKELQPTTCKLIGKIFYAFISVIIFPIGIARLIGLAIRKFGAGQIVAASKLPARLENMKLSSDNLQSLKHYLIILKTYHEQLNGRPILRKDNLEIVFDRLLEGIPADLENLKLSQVKPTLRKIVDNLKGLNNFDFALIMNSIDFQIGSTGSPYFVNNEGYFQAIRNEVYNNRWDNQDAVIQYFSHLLHRFQDTKEFGSIFKRAILLKDPEASSLTITTADNVKLDGIYINRNADPKALTVVQFMCSGMPYEQGYFLNMIPFPPKPLDEYGYEVPYNIALVNYRGVGQSKGKVTPNGIKIDGFSTVRAVHEGLGTGKIVPLNQIVSSGHSLGAAVATYAAARHQSKDKSNPFSGMTCRNDRGFAELPSTMTHILQQSTSKCLAKMGSCMARMAGWNWDCRKWWNEISGFKWALYHPLDRDIPEHVALGRYASEKSSGYSIKMEEGAAGEAHMIIPQKGDRERDRNFITLLTEA